jgi:hypothetical protein
MGVDEAPEVEGGSLDDATEDEGEDDDTGEADETTVDAGADDGAPDRDPAEEDMVGRRKEKKKIGEAQKDVQRRRGNSTRRCHGGAKEERWKGELGAW